MEVSKELPMSPFGSHLGIEIEETGKGIATCKVMLQDFHFNTGGRVHGGVLSSLADTTAGVAVRSIRPEGSLTATTDLSIAFIRPPGGDELIARAEVIHTGKRLYRVEIKINCEEKLVATCSATFMIVSEG